MLHDGVPISPHHQNRIRDRIEVHDNEWKSVNELHATDSSLSYFDETPQARSGWRPQESHSRMILPRVVLFNREKMTIQLMYLDKAQGKPKMNLLRYFEPL